MSIANSTGTRYPEGIVVSQSEMASINIKRANFHGESSHTIAPSRKMHQALIS